MKLWIRNQTRTEIMECNHLSVKETVVPNKKKSEWSIVANFGWVGAYESMERCLEIIDEIQDALCGNVWKYKGTGFVDKVTIEPISENVVAVINKEIIELPHHDTFVYEMPEE